MDDWIFVASIDKNNLITGEEKHYVCDDLVGLEQFLNDKKEYLINK